MTVADPETSLPSDSPHPVWLHRLMVLVVCLVWPLIWVGGLVTTYDAGMSVPDWPATYGFNLFLYPYKTWLLGPFDLFIEHGHRLLGALVGFVAIAMVVVAFIEERRRWVRWLSVAILIMVIVQGCLGGVRVVMSDRGLAMIHGCFGQLFFAVCAAVAVTTGRRWFVLRESAAPAGNQAGEDGSLSMPGFGTLAACVLLTGVGYMQIVFGAMIRHVQPTATPSSFAGMVAMHIMTAFLLWTLAMMVWWCLRKCGDLTLSRTSGFLLGLVSVQIGFGIGTWAVKYGWPTVLRSAPWAETFLVRAKGFVDSMIVTAHVAIGAAILAVSAVILVRALRRRWLIRYDASLLTVPVAN